MHKYNPDEFCAEYDNGVFRCYFQCVSDHCAEVVQCVGQTWWDQRNWEEEGGYASEYYQGLTPTMFEPPLKVFDIPPNTPKRVRESITASFRVLFLSTGSALNEVRNALEFLMDHLEVPREGTSNGGKKYRLSLEGRVNLMQPPHEHYKELLIAVKWLGNYGTHAEETTREDVLNAYDILYHVLDGMFSGNADRIKQLAAGINAKEKAKKLAGS
jgi:hypothetical protein